MKGQYDWIDLSSAFYWMRETFLLSIFNHEGALKNALRSHEVPTRGKAYLSAAYQRIEKNITADTEFLVTANMMRTSHQVPIPGRLYLSNTTVSFEAVQVDRRSFEEWIKSNAIEHSEAPTAAAKARAAKPDANYEQRATDYLIGKMETNRGMKHKDARKACTEKFPNLTDRAFERRVWPKAKAAIRNKTADTIRIKKA